MMSALYLTNTLFISASSCCLHVPPLGHINLILSQSVFDLAPENCVLSGEAANANFIVFVRPDHGSRSTILEARMLTW